MWAFEGGFLSYKIWSCFPFSGRIPKKYSLLKNLMVLEISYYHLERAISI